MSETPKERRGNHIMLMGDAARKCVLHDNTMGAAMAAYDALLAALEPPVAEMVRRGVEEHVAHGGHENVPTGWYRPRAEFMRGEHPADPHGTVEP